MAEDYFDLVDLDVFGSDSSFTAAAMSAAPLAVLPR
jgi:tRNA G26 N,N-dimethylase Trm1